jgi:hypothetical protein
LFRLETIRQNLVTISNTNKIIHNENRKDDYLLKSKDRLGLTKENNNGTMMKIIEVLPDDRLLVQFQDDHKFEKNIHWNNFKNGNVKNPYDRTLYGVGFIGDGKYNKPTSKDGNERSYNTWMAMHERCYTKYDKLSNYAYYDCEVCEEWHNYQMFAEWYHNNYYDIGEGRMHLDKDIIHRGNKTYAPENCMFIPQRINMIFMEKGRVVDNGLPTAIEKRVKGYCANYNGRSLGIFKTLDEAIIKHDNAKRAHIKKVADEYRNRIPNHVYEALIGW